jgi:hypothetical protein
MRFLKFQKLKLFPTMNWIDNLYKETRQVWENHGKDKRGYAIFYSPVKVSPFIALIGINPGGDEKSFDENEVDVPQKHQYLTDNYPLAVKMKTIFAAAGMLKDLEESVKFNLLFFRSKEAHEIVNKQLIEYSIRKALEIIDHLKPKIIITEGFTVFDKLKVTKMLNEFALYDEDMKPLIVVAKAKGDTPLIGLKHPSSGYTHLTGKELTAMGKHLHNIIHEIQLEKS